MHDFRYLNDLRQLSAQLLYNVKLDGYGLYRFGNKLLYAIPFAAVV